MPCKRSWRNEPGIRLHQVYLEPVDLGRLNQLLRGRVVLTLFAIPKPFAGHIGVIQRNAIKSWTLLRPQCEILLLGDDEGTADAAEEFGVRHIPQVARNELGTPLLNDMFETAQTLGGHDLCCFVNADIILMDDFIEAVQRVATCKNYFLMAGRPWDVRINEPLGFESSWAESLRMRAASQGKLRSTAAIDYFVFRRGVWGDIPPFAIGRPGYDNWLLYRARSRKAAVIDATENVMAVHQNHEYPPHLQVVHGIRRNSPEAKRNLDLAGGSSFIFTLMDATHMLTPEGLRLVLDWRHLCRRVTRIPVLYPRFGYPFRLLSLAGDFTRPFRLRLGLTLAEKSSRHG
jgi:hypothetical protein